MAKEFGRIGNKKDSRKEQARNIRLKQGDISERILGNRAKKVKEEINRNKQKDDKELQNNKKVKKQPGKVFGIIKNESSNDNSNNYSKKKVKIDIDEFMKAVSHHFLNYPNAFIDNELNTDQEKILKINFNERNGSYPKYIKISVKPTVVEYWGVLPNKLFAEVNLEVVDCETTIVLKKIRNSFSLEEGMPVISFGFTYDSLIQEQPKLIESSFLHAVRVSDLEKIKNLLPRCGPNVYSEVNDKRAIEIAILYGDVQVTKLLLEYGANISFKKWDLEQISKINSSLVPLLSQYGAQQQNWKAVQQVIDNREKSDNGSNGWQEEKQLSASGCIYCGNYLAPTSNMVCHSCLTVRSSGLWR